MVAVPVVVGRDAWQRLGWRLFAEDLRVSINPVIISDVFPQLRKIITTSTAQRITSHRNLSQSIWMWVEWPSAKPVALHLLLYLCNHLIVLQWIRLLYFWNKLIINAPTCNARRLAFYSKALSLLSVALSSTFIPSCLRGWFIDMSCCCCCWNATWEDVKLTMFSPVQLLLLWSSVGRSVGGGCLLF